MQPNRTLLVLGFLLASSSVATAEPATMSDQEATIMTMGADHMMKPIREGSNGWTCMDPGGAPMCADQAAMEWVQAWQEKGPAPQKIGFTYMLKGDGGTSNTNRYGTRDTADIGAGRGSVMPEADQARRHPARRKRSPGDYPVAVPAGSWSAFGADRHAQSARRSGAGPRGQTDRAAPYLE